DSECCSRDDIKSAYRRLLLQNHPDKNQDDDKKLKCTEKYIFIQRAYKILGESTSRMEYNSWLREQRLRRKDEHLIIYDSINLDVIDDNEHGPVESHSVPCRCGDFFHVKRNDIDALIDFVLIPCGVCSLYLKIERSKI
uniref:Uncharacterized protein n=1 Tax=Romanomermis culicivorax TaxID=13658 RepID=A0A915IAA5_ROMCU